MSIVRNNKIFLNGIHILKLPSLVIKKIGSTEQKIGTKEQSDSEETSAHLPRKRNKIESETLETIFHYNCQREKKAVDSFVESSELKAFSLNLSDGSNNDVEIVALSSQEKINNVLSISEHNNIDASSCIRIIENELEKVYEKKLDDYLFQRIYNNKYRGILKYDNFQEIDEELLNLLNTDWGYKNSIRLAYYQMLSGCILVEGKQILLVNCNELHGRLPTLDRHRERFSASSSLPNVKDKYERIKVNNITADNSSKLVIGIFTFNILITSSLRLDEEDIKPQLGSGTLNVQARNNTRIYLSEKSKKLAL